MTERERWIVYPLLFLALGAALRDKLSEHTKTKTIECQELIVYGDESQGEAPKPLVRIGGMPRDSADSPHLGQILVDGMIQAQVVTAAEAVQAANINADNYFFRQNWFAPLRAIPGVSPIDQLRAQQLQQHAAEAEKAEAERVEAQAKTPQAEAEPVEPGHSAHPADSPAPPKEAAPSDE